MKCQISPLLIGVFTIITLSLDTAPADADHLRDINRYARRIESTASSIARETRHFHHSPYFACLVNDSQQLRRLAGHVRELARDGCNLRHLQRDVMALGSAYQVLEAKFCFVERAAPTCHNTRRVRRLLNNIQEDIQKMLICLSQLVRPYGSFHPHPGFGHPGFGHPGFGSNWGGMPSQHFGDGGWGNFDGAHQSGAGFSNSAAHFRADLRHPTVAQMQHQSLHRSAELDRQLRDLRMQNQAFPRTSLW